MRGPERQQAIYLDGVSGRATLDMRAPPQTDAMICEMAARVPSGRGWAAALLVLMLAGCGSSTPSSGLAPDDAAQMRAHLAQVTTAAADGNPQEATRALRAFAADASSQRASGHLTSAEYAALKTGIARAQQRLAAEVTKPTPTPTPPTTTPASPQPAPVVPTDPGHGKGPKDKGPKGPKGNGGGGGGGGGD